MSALMLAVQNGMFVPLNCRFVCSLMRRVTAIADKLGLEFALFHRKRDGKKPAEEEVLELLVGDVKGKVCLIRVSLTACM